jgi:hypothetical protein
MSNFRKLKNHQLDFRAAMPFVSTASPAMLAPSVLRDLVRTLTSLLYASEQK